MIKKLLESLAGSVLQNIEPILDEIPSAEKKTQLKNDLVEKVRLLFSDAVNSSNEIIKAEIQGNKLQRSWRPLAMMCFLLIIVTNYFVLPLLNVFLRDFDLQAYITYAQQDKTFLELLKNGLFGYGALRTGEKIISEVTKNIDLTFLKKKDRSSIFKL